MYEHDDEMAHARERLYRQARILRREDEEARARGVESDGSLRVGWYARMDGWAEQSPDPEAQFALARLFQVNTERVRLAEEGERIMRVLREFEDVCVLIDRARGKGGRGW